MIPRTPGDVLPFLVPISDLVSLILLIAVTKTYVQLNVLKSNYVPSFAKGFVSKPVGKKSIRQIMSSTFD